MLDVHRASQRPRPLPPRLPPPRPSPRDPSPRGIGRTTAHESWRTPGADEARGRGRGSAGATFSSNCDAKRPRVSADRNRAEEDADADRGEGLPGPSPSASSAMDEPKRWTNRSGRVPVPVGGNALPKKTKQTKQLFLDLGQKSFGHVTCPTCGLLYAKGEREDERTHRGGTTPRTSSRLRLRAESATAASASASVSSRRGAGGSSPRRGTPPTGAKPVVVCGRRRPREAARGGA